MTSVIEHSTQLPPIAQFKNLIQFLNTVNDDPADCVSSATIDQITRVERRLIVLDTGKQTLEPDWLFHCNKIDKNTAWCGGSELDTSAQLPEANFGARAEHSFPAHSPGVPLHIHINDAYACKIIGVYGSSSLALQAGKPANLLAHNQTDIKSSRLPAKYPVLIVALGCDDKLRYRKAVWHLY